MNRIKRTLLFSTSEKGQGLIEYALILALAAILTVVVRTNPNPLIVNLISTLNNMLQGR